MNLIPTTCTLNSPQAFQFFYKFKNEKKKHSIILKDDAKYPKSDKLDKFANFLSVKEIKKLIYEHSIQSKDFDLVLYEENYKDQEMPLKNCRLVERDKTIIVERVPWYKLEKLEEKILISKQISKEMIEQNFECKLCHQYIKDKQFLMMICCGETGCEDCLEKYNDNNYSIGEDSYIRHDFINDNKFFNKDCPFCSTNLKNNENKINAMPNKRLTELRDYLKNIEEHKIELESKFEKEINERKSSMQNTINNTNTSDTFNISPISMTKLFPIQNCINYFPDQIKETNLNNQFLNSNNHKNNCINPHNIFFDDSRFFIIKSCNKENIEISQLHNEWATTVTNQQKLNDAFSHNNIILIFSANKSRVFQGYAVMKSYITGNLSNIWNHESSIKLGGTFAVQWLCSCELPFAKVKHLSNPLNNNDPVVKSRDTQELPTNLGLTLCNLCFEQEKLENLTNRIKPIFDVGRINSILAEIIKNRAKGIDKNLITSISRSNSIDINNNYSCNNDIKSRNLISDNYNIRNFNKNLNPGPNFYFYNNQHIKSYLTPTITLPFTQMPYCNYSSYYNRNNFYNSQNYILNKSKKIKRNSRSRSRSKDS